MTLPENMENGKATTQAVIASEAKQSPGLPQSPTSKLGIASAQTARLAMTRAEHLHGKITIWLGQKGPKCLVAIAVAALFLLNLNVAWADGSASIGDYVWDDQNGDKEQTSEFDVGINGVVVELYKDGIWQESFTTQNHPSSGEAGWYLFDSLDAGDYVVKVADSNFESGGVLHDYTLTTDNHPLSVHLEQGETFSEADFGYVAVAYPAGPAEPTAVTLSSFMASSASRGASHWPWLTLLATLAAGGALWTKQR